MKKGKLLWMAVIAALVLVPTMSWAQAKISTRGLPATEPSFMVELYVGGGAATSSSTVFRNLRAQNLDPFLRISGSHPGIDPYVLGGLKFGYWFTPYGTYGITSLPDWMKYFGFYTDFSYQKLNFGNRTSTFNAPLIGVNGFVGFDTSGSLATWAFMFAGRYGFFQDSEVPFGRLQPYVAAGPAIFFSYQDPTINLTTLGGNGVGFSPAGKSAINVGLAVETGLRYFFNKSISVEASFKYRMFTPKYTYTGNTLIGLNPIVYDTQLKPTFNLYSGQIGVAYHF